MTLKSKQHETKLDRSYVESVFESFSVKSQQSQATDGTSNDELRIVTKGNAVLAYEEIFNMWKVDLTLTQQKKVKDVYFKQSWSKYVDEDGNLDLKDAYRFLKDMMTLPLIRQDPQTAK